MDSFNPNADNAVTTMAIQTDGKIVIGGIFANVGNQARSCIARLNQNGTLDATFNPGAGGLSISEVNALSLQPDGKILVGGQFTSLAGSAVNYTGRLNPDGTLDAAFNPNADLAVISIIPLTNGQILVAGSFTNIDGQLRPELACLNTNGTLDTNFNAQASGHIATTILQPDGKILVGGFFTNLAGASRNYIGRLNADGTLDTNFNPGASSNVTAMCLQPDGKILVGGFFTNLAGASRNSIGRLNTNGTIDATFNPGATGGTPVNSVRTFLLQTDGAILVGGNFTTLGGQTQNFIGRLNSDGSLDGAFNVSASGGHTGTGVSLTPSVEGLSAQGDGSILVCGGFTAMGSLTRNYIGRLTNNSAATQTLGLSANGTTITWARSGASPEVQSVTFESSPDGQNYSLLGSGTRINGGWQLTGLSVPATRRIYIRARGQFTGGEENGSTSVIESDNQFFSSTATTVLTAPTALPSGAFQFGFTNANSNFTVLAAGNITTPASNWVVLGIASNVSPSHFQFTDTNARSFPARFYRVRSP